MADPNIQAAAANLQKAASQKLYDQQQMKLNADRLRRETENKVNDLKRELHSQEANAATSTDSAQRQRASQASRRIIQEVDKVKTDVKQQVQQMEQTAAQITREAQDLQNLAHDLQMRA